jgi:hypothetical protein
MLEMVIIQNNVQLMNFARELKSVRFLRTVLLEKQFHI